jgi:general secretion pathway protein A
MYQEFFGLRDLPFELTPDPRFLFMTPRHAEALANLQYAISTAKGVAVLIGEAGTGKTTIIRAALEQQRTNRVRCVYLNNPTLTRDEFVEFLAKSFALSVSAQRSKSALVLELEERLKQDRAQDVKWALVVDEAQSLPHDLLEEVRLLANVETETDKLLPVVLAGQPELAARLNDVSLRQLKQRVALRCELSPLRLQETASYVAARLRVAGGDASKIFTREAVVLIHEQSGGIPRTISVLADNALVSGFALDRRPVGREIVADVCRDFDIAEVRPRRTDTTSAGQPAAPQEGAVEPSHHREDVAAADAAPKKRKFSFF